MYGTSFRQYTTHKPNTTHEQSEAPAMPDIDDTTRPASLSRLVKLIGMATSSNDNEALTALRAANREAEKFGGWRRILTERITVVGDPFAELEAPRVKATVSPAPRPYPTPPPAAPSTSHPAYGTAKPNLFATTCRSCGQGVDDGAGWIVAGGGGAWIPSCDPCYQSNFKPQTRQTAQPSWQQPPMASTPAPPVGKPRSRRQTLQQKLNDI